MNDELLITILKTIRTYLIRRRIMGLSQGENKNIVLLCKNIEAIAKQCVDIFDLLSNMFYKMRFPNDNEIKNILNKMDFYNNMKKYSKFILGKIEENNTKVTPDFRNPKITIEHIMPQTLSKNWENELGDNHKETHKNFLHNIGNLILTEFNKEIGNKKFAEKKEKLETSSLNFRLDIIYREVWNKESILDHQEKMITWFLETFPLPEKYRETENYSKKIVETKNFSPIDEDAKEIAEGNRPSKLTIDGKNIHVRTWQDVFIEFLKWQKDSKEYDFNVIYDNQNELFNREKTIVKWSELKTMIDDYSDLGKRYKTFDGKFYDRVDNLTLDLEFIHINCSSYSFITRIANIMNKFNMPDDFVEITLRGGNNSDEFSQD
jgi:hypothetical protein